MTVPLTVIMQQTFHASVSVDCNFKQIPLSPSLPVCVGHILLLIAQTGFFTNQFIIEQLVQPFPDQVPRAHKEVTERTQWFVD